jgi:hypothetical protein
MSALFKNTSNLLTELSSQNPANEGAGDSLDFSPELITKMEELSQLTQTELSRELQHIESYFFFLHV